MENTWNFSPTLNRTSNSESIFNLKERLSALKNSKNKTLKFEKVTLDSSGVISRYLNKYGNHSCDFSIGGILMWAEYFNYEYAIYSDTLFLRGADPSSNQVLYYEPIGELDKDTAIELLNEYSNEESNSLLLFSEEEDYDNYLENSHDSSVYIDDWKEYVYPIERFMGFPGKKMSKKRNHLNYFKNHYSDYKVEEISSLNIGELVKFTNHFNENHDESPVFANEAQQTIQVLKDYSSYPFFGLAIRYDNKIIAYSIAEKVGDICFMHIEKGDIDYQGVYQAIASEMATFISCHFPDVKYLNREEDMGFESLRKSKESYHPSLIINKKYVRLPLIIEKRLAI